MRLDAKTLDRAVGALLGAAAGDALGVHYETGLPVGPAGPQLLGGGFGGIAPGQWSDDTEMAIAIARVAAEGADLRARAWLDDVADGFLEWYGGHPPDVGMQTRAVLSRGRVGRHSAERLMHAAAALHEQTGRTAGNGSLMRTSPVALAHLGDTDAIVEAAHAVSALTHHDQAAGDACVLWCLAIDHAVRTGTLDVRVGLPHVDPMWGGLLDEAAAQPPSYYAHNNGWVVAALLGAWSAISSTDSYEAGVVAAVAGGGDTDTVAAIAGALLGARYGASSVPARWRRKLHGWPGMHARDLSRLAVLAATKGRPDRDDWPICRTMPYGDAETTTVPHPDDPGVLLGAVGALRPGVADAIVSLCRLGSEQAPLTADPADHVEVWLVDQEDANNDLAFVIADAARAVQQLRGEGKTVFLHCVHAHTRTPVVAAAYGALVTGRSTKDALARVLHVLPEGDPRPSIRAVLEQLDMTCP